MIIIVGTWHLIDILVSYAPIVESQHQFISDMNHCVDADAWI